MRHFYDCEFLENGRTIELISIGIAAEDGRELYLINNEIYESGALWHRICHHDWLMANVIPHLPLLEPPTPRRFDLNLKDPRVATRRDIRDQVGQFLTAVNPPSLWAWYGAYDHVALAQLFGPMTSMPPQIPYWTNDLRQEARRLGVIEEHILPRDGGEHDALADARWNRDLYRRMAEIAAALGKEITP